MKCALIMAGGRGTRFWPLSTDEKPKQFLNLVSERSMLQMTVDRLKGIVDEDKIFIITGKSYEELVKNQVPNIPSENIILEPLGRNTAPCIALAAMIINKRFKDANLIILPADHLIVDVEKFKEIIKRGEALVDKHKEHIVTLGINPTRPETGYGYINFKKDYSENAVKEVKGFVEKPNLDLAITYLSSGDYLWNSGMFIWNSNCIEKLTRRFLSNTYNIISNILNDENFENSFKKNYQFVDNISVDFAIMEKYERIFVIPSDFGWDDIGTWSALERYREKDKANNMLSGEVNVVSGNNNIIFSKNKKFNVIDISDLFIVENDDMVLITKRENAEKIKDMKQMI